MSNLNTGWRKILEQQEAIILLSENIQTLIKDEIHKAMRNGAHEPNAILLGPTEFAALKKSIEDNIYFKYPSLGPEGVLYNGLNVYQFVGSGIRVCTVHN